MLTPVFVLMQSLSACVPQPTTTTNCPPTPLTAPAVVCVEAVVPSIASAFGADERTQLLAAQQLTPELGVLRAGFAPSNEQWGWIAIGGLIVLLIILI